ncbi:MAG TPA: hypothetical protein VMN57_01425 [Anaerolineales bacterium]|nr:hypothetical protein [Anaerolineales bacterium]
MNKPNRILLPVLAAAILIAALYAGPALADPVCDTVWDPVNQVWVTICTDDGGGSSGGGGGSGGGSGGGGGGSCTPGETVVSTVIIGGDMLCEVWLVWHDACTGQVSYAILVDVIAGGSCTAPDPGSGSANAANPCIELAVTPGGVHCVTDWGIEWLLEASVGFPSAFLDLRPYPVTLVSWPSAARNGGTPSASGSDSLDYIAYGGGDPDDPELGDWREVRLTLRLVPAAPLLFFTMPTIGTLALPDVGANGLPVTIEFTLPSHPEAGADVLAGSIGLHELPADLPVFSGSAVTAYRLFWSLRFEEYERDCRPGPDPFTGGLYCRTSNQADADDGHWEYDWEDRGMGGEITPQMVVGLPPGMAADLDGDGSPDAYWNRKVTIRRMDNDGSVTGGVWNWSGAVYWAVREGQGQIGWPR